MSFINRRGAATQAVCSNAEDGTQTVIVADIIGGATPAQTLALLTEPQYIRTWCHGEITHRGGTLTISFPDPAITAQIVYHDGDVVRYSWCHSNWLSAETRVTVKLTPVAQATFITLTQQGLADRDVPAALEFWQSDVLSPLRRALAANRPGPIGIVTAEEQHSWPS